MLVQLQVAEELLQVVDRQVHQLGDGSSAYLYIAGFLLQTGAVAGRTIGLTPIACQHHAVLNLILVLLQHLEEGVDASLFSRAVPQIVLLLLSQLIVRSEDGEVVSRGFVQEFLQPFAHLFASPAHHGTVVYGECPVRDNQLFVNANHLAETLAGRTGTDGRVE